MEKVVQRCNYQGYNRRNNLRVCVLEEHPNEPPIQVSTLVLDKLQLPSVSVERAHKTGPVRYVHPRAVLVRFEKFRDREAVMQNAKKPKDPSIYVNDEFCPTPQDTV